MSLDPHRKEQELSSLLSYHLITKLSELRKSTRNHLTQLSHCPEEATKAWNRRVACPGPHTSVMVKPSLESDAGVSSCNNCHGIFFFFLSHISSLYKLFGSIPCVSGGDQGSPPALHPVPWKFSLVQCVCQITRVEIMRILFKN